MKITPLDELISAGFKVEFVNALEQFWHTTKCFRCIGEPKRHNLFLYLDGCTITYTDKNNNTYTAQSGDVVYTPAGSEYIAHLSDFKSEKSHTVGINFFLFDDSGEPLILSDGITVFPAAKNQAISVLFKKALHYDITPAITPRRILLMDILCMLSSGEMQKDMPSYLARALQYMAEHIEESPTVARLSEVAGVSEVYLRRQFKRYLNTSPLEYRSTLRLNRARTYLEYGDISVQEISDALGYSTVSHFIKQFKEACGCSPLRYRKLSRKA